MSAPIFLYHTTFSNKENIQINPEKIRESKFDLSAICQSKIQMNELDSIYQAKVDSLKKIYEIN